MLPEEFAAGEPARLIPICSDQAAELRAVSVLLAAISAVPEFASAVLGALGQKTSARTTISAFTEVIFRNGSDHENFRNDGVLIVNTGRREWRTLIEGKVKNSRLDGDQIAGYCELAKRHDLDAIITVSNEFAARPTHVPYSISARQTRNISLFHWSWMYIATQVSLLLHNDTFGSVERRFILRELDRFLADEKAGISGFSQMNREWKDLVNSVRDGTGLTRHTPGIEPTVSAWFAEQRDLALILSRKVGALVDLRISRRHANDPARRLKDECANLVETKQLSCQISVPDAAAPIEVVADLSLRTIACGMRLDAPQDKKRTSARVNWVLRQLAKSDAENVLVRGIWPGRAPATQSTLLELRDRPDVLQGQNSGLVPTGFEIRMVWDLAGKFSGLRTFVEALEELVPYYYEQVGQNLRAWAPKPPQVRPLDKETDLEHEPEDRAQSDLDQS